MTTKNNSDVTVIQTGGTIDKDYPRTTGGYAFEIGDAAVGKVLSRVKCVLDYQIHTVCKKDSQYITDNDRKEILSLCQTSINEKILITHGTDTLLDTAMYLENANIIDKKVLLTGAHKPETFKESDADFNIGVCVGALQCLQTPGIYVAMNGAVYLAKEVKRNMETGQFIFK